ncbi:hypothetical protein AWW66_10025 [Micromonospora rosaria]|uniref:ABC transporter permease n=1 Tax=Micromonospora rosaria TaxID=47874 RepID=A0A136PUA7_9ACTN|nr:ABC transporter permease [Micromonospora rosaria]KXK62081.1 hypothetical protein AWW66_10025 [Micromonospora rosaria]
MRTRQLRGVVAAEWTRFWTVPATWWGLAGLAVLVAVAAVTVGGGRATVPAGFPPERFVASEPVTTALGFAQFGLVAVALLAVTSEYASGGIRATLQATPVRGRLFAAKALVVAPVLGVLTALFALVGTVLTAALLALDVFVVEVLLDPARIALDLLRIGGYAALVALLTIGVAFALRSAAGALSVVFLLLAGLPLLLAMTGSAAAVQVAMRTPTLAGLTFLGSAEITAGGLPAYPPWEGLAWLLGWTALALAAGFGTLRHRDA